MACAAASAVKAGDVLVYESLRGEKKDVNCQASSPNREEKRGEEGEEDVREAAATEYYMKRPIMAVPSWTRPDYAYAPTVGNNALVMCTQNGTKKMSPEDSRLRFRRK